MARNLNDDWYKQAVQQEKERQQKIKKSKEYEAKGIPHVDRLAVRYDTSDKKTKKFVESKGTASNKSSKWRTDAVDGLSSKKYGKKYNDRLNKLMDEEGIPQSDRYGFMKWMDAQEKGISSINDKALQEPRLNEQQMKRYKQPALKGIDWVEHKKNADQERKTAELSATTDRLGSSKQTNIGEDFINFVKGLNPFGDTTEQERANTIHSVLDKAEGNKAVSEVDRFATRATNKALLGLPEAMSQDAPEFQKRTGGGNVADIIADFAGYGAGGFGATMGLRGAGLTGKGVRDLVGAKASGQLTKDVVKRGALSAAGEGALVNGGMAGIESGIRLGTNENAVLEDELKNIAMNTALGAVIDPALTAGLPALKLASNNAVQKGINNQLGGMLRNTEPQLQLPAPQLRLPAPENGLPAPNQPLALPAPQLRLPAPVNPIEDLVSQAQAPKTNAQSVLDELTLPKSIRMDKKEFFNQLNADPRYRAVQDPILELQKRIGETPWKSPEYAKLQDELYNLRNAEAPVRAQVETDIKRNAIAQQMGVERSVVDELIARRDAELAAQEAGEVVPTQAPETTPVVPQPVKEQYENISTGSNDPGLVRATPMDDILDRIKNTQVQREGMNRSNVEETLDELLGPRVREEAQKLEGQEPTLPPQPPEGAMDQDFIDYSVKKNKSVKNTLVSAQKSFTNDLAPVRQIDEAIKDMDANDTLRYLNPKTWIKGKKQLAADSSLEKSLTNSKGARSVAAEHVVRRFGEFMKKLNKSSVAQQDLEKYAFARHGITLLDNQAAQKQQYDILTEELSRLEALGDTDEAAMLRELIEGFTMYQLPKGATRDVLVTQAQALEQNPQLSQMYDEFISLQRENIEDMYSGGLISENLYETLLRNETYIPMKRNFTPQDTTGIASRRPQTPLDRMTETGSEERIKSPIQEAIRNAYVTRFNIEKNKALQVIPKFAKIDKEATMFKRVQEPNKNTISFFQDGKPVFYEVPPALKNYVDNFGATSDPDILTNTVQKLAQMQRKLTTQYSLSFQLKSLLREPAQAIMTSRTSKNFVDGVKQTSLGYIDAFMGPQLENLTKDLPQKLQFKSYKQQWKDMGGTGFQFINMTDEDLQRVAKDLMGEGTKGKVKYLNPLESIGKFGENIEAGARLGEFRSAKRQGYPDADAFYEATDITNYKRSGTVTREANKYMPFLNATVQGNSRVIRAIQEAPVRTVARGIGMLSSTAIGAYSIRYMDGVSDEQRNELKNLTDWQKNSYTYVPDPRPGNESIYAIPKAFAVGQMFMNPVERALDDYTNTIMDDPTVGDHIKKGLVDTLKSFAPPNEVAGLTTAYELKMNKALFTGFEIESSYDEDLPKKDREAYDQSLVGSGISDLLNMGSEEGWVSPAQIDYILKDLTGSVGTRTLQGIDQFKENKPTETLLDQVLNPVSQFTLDTRQGGSGLENLKKYKREEGLTKKEAEDDENYYNYHKAMDDLNKEVQDIRKDSSLSSKEKSRRIRNIRKEQDQVNSDSIDYFNRLNN